MTPRGLRERQRTLKGQHALRERVLGEGELGQLELASDDEIAEAMEEHLGALCAATGRAFAGVPGASGGQLLERAVLRDRGRCVRLLFGLTHAASPPSL